MPGQLGEVTKGVNGLVIVGATLFTGVEVMFVNLGLLISALTGLPPNGKIVVAELSNR
jgi:hypothetical protein